MCMASRSQKVPSVLTFTPHSAGLPLSYLPLVSVNLLVGMSWIFFSDRHAEIHDMSCNIYKSLKNTHWKIILKIMSLCFNLRSWGIDGFRTVRWIVTNFSDSVISVHCISPGTAKPSIIRTSQLFHYFHFHYTKVVDFFSRFVRFWCLVIIYFHSVRCHWVPFTYLTSLKVFLNDLLSTLESVHLWMVTRHLREILSHMLLKERKGQKSLENRVKRRKGMYRKQHFWR